MQELVKCEICESIVEQQDIDGYCKVCLRPTCKNCSRTCDTCQKIVCMKHLDAVIIRRQDQPFFLKICTYCKEVWV